MTAKPRFVDTVVVHCSATRPGALKNALAEIRRWHVKERGWSDIGYHALILEDGRLEIGRSLALDGAHVRGHNKGSIGVCLIGGLTPRGKPAPTYTPEQWATLVRIPRLVHRWACARFIDLAPSWRVYGHHDFDSGKACPCFDVRAFFRRALDGQPVREFAAAHEPWNGEERRAMLGV